MNKLSLNEKVSKATGRTWVEINLDAIKYNLNEIKKIISPSTKIMGIIKADAYGHGFYETAKVLKENGVGYFGVSMLDEALQIRKTDTETPVLMLSDNEESRINDIINNDITSAVFTYDFAEKLSKEAVKLNKTAKIHLKVDTGMGRLGINPSKDLQTVIKISKLPNLNIEGIFTHFAVADEEDESYTRNQYAKFKDFCDKIEQNNIKIPLKHCANSAAIIRFPEMQLDMVRAGVILYGLYPSEYIRSLGISFKPAMTLKTRITYIKTTDKESYISYGCTYIAKAGTKIATIPVGYADGYLRRLGNNADVAIKNQRARIIGRICMDQCMVDVTDIPVLNIGDEVVLFGNENITCDELAERSGTINYEIVCLIGKRLPHVYYSNNEISAVDSGLNY